MVVYYRETEPVSLAHLYINKYKRWFEEAQKRGDPDLPRSALKTGGKLLDEYVCSEA